MSRRASPKSFAATIPITQSGCYSLIITLRSRKKIRVGRLGVGIFPAGTYVYTGSAMNGLGARLRRHLRRNKKLHWHIDYLLASVQARIRKIIVYPPLPGQECRQNQKIAALPGAAIVIEGFGATDCRRGCTSHLVYFSRAKQVKLTGGEIISTTAL